MSKLNEKVALITGGSRGIGSIWNSWPIQPVGSGFQWWPTRGHGLPGSNKHSRSRCNAPGDVCVLSRTDGEAYPCVPTNLEM